MLLFEVHMECSRCCFQKNMWSTPDIASISTYYGVFTGLNIQGVSAAWPLNCQAQPQFQLSLAESALVLISPASWPSTGDRAALNKQKTNLTCFELFGGLI
jgi:hypothetical protein